MSPLDTAVAETATDWPVASPEDAGLTPDLGDRMDAAVKTDAFTGLHGVLVVRHGKLVLERYFEGPDERWGTPLGNVTFGPEVVHDLRSVSKSIVGLLYGIALSEGIVPDLDRPLVDQFPAYPNMRKDLERRRMTVGHALTMTLGTEWNEDLPYSDPRNSEIAMEMAADRYRFILERPFVTEPGSKWDYNGGATAVLAHLISRGAGTPLFDYAREKLFDPLGIVDAEWVLGTNGEAAAASGLRLRPRDLAKIGQMILGGGRWRGKQLVPMAWLEQSFTPHIRTNGELGYGYQWWLGKLHVGGNPWMGAFGNGGQRLAIFPSVDLLVIVTAGNYNKSNAWKLPVAIIAEVVFPAIQD